MVKIINLSYVNFTSISKLFYLKKDLCSRHSIFYFWSKAHPSLQHFTFPTDNLWETNCFSKHSAKIQGSESFMVSLNQFKACYEDEANLSNSE